MCTLRPLQAGAVGTGFGHCGSQAVRALLREAE